MFILQLILDCDLYLPQASWVSYAPQCEILGKKAIWIESQFKDDYKLTPENFEKNMIGKSKNSLLILNYPCNPSNSHLIHFKKKLEFHTVKKS
jgi:aspartate aminotransferase